MSIVKKCKQTAMISSCSKLEIRWRGLWLKAMSMIDTSIKTYWIRIFIQNLTLYRLCSLEHQYVEKRNHQYRIHSHNLLSNVPPSTWHNCFVQKGTHQYWIHIHNICFDPQAPDAIGFVKKGTFEHIDVTSL